MGRSEGPQRRGSSQNRQRKAIHGALRLMGCNKQVVALAAA